MDFILPFFIFNECCNNNVQHFEKSQTFSLSERRGANSCVVAVSQLQISWKFGVGVVPCCSISYLAVASTLIVLQCENSLSQIFLFWKHLCTKVLLASHRNYLKGISCSLLSGLVTDTTFFCLFFTMDGLIKEI